MQELRDVDLDIQSELAQLGYEYLGTSDVCEGGVMHHFQKEIGERDWFSFQYYWDEDYSITGSVSLVLDLHPDDFFEHPMAQFEVKNLSQMDIERIPQFESGLLTARNAFKK